MAKNEIRVGLGLIGTSIAVGVTLFARNSRASRQAEVYRNTLNSTQSSLQPGLAASLPRRVAKRI